MAKNPNQADELKILRLANAQGRFAITIGARMSPTDQYALERLQEREWVRLVDITPLPSKPGLYRVFMLTKSALEFLKKSPP